MIDKKEIKICYLCGKELSGDIDRDHIPAKQFFPKSLRGEIKDKPIIFPTHRKCNLSFEFDEKYFMQSLGSIATDTLAGKELLKDMKIDAKRQE